MGYICIHHDQHCEIFKHFPKGIHASFAGHSVISRWGILAGWLIGQCRARAGEDMQNICQGQWNHWFSHSFCFHETISLETDTNDGGPKIMLPKILDNLVYFPCSFPCLYLLYFLSFLLFSPCAPPQPRQDEGHMSKRSLCGGLADAP